MRNLLFFLVAVIILSFDPHLAVAADEVATVTKLRNSAHVFRKGQQIALNEGFKIEEFDEVLTGKDTRVEITFIDGTKLNIGEHSNIVIDKFLFDPVNHLGIAILRSLEGAFRFVTGNIGKVNQPQIVVQSRFGVIGVRGTDFWAGPSRGVYGVLLLDGSISVVNPMGQRILTAPGTGVNLTGNDAPPSEVTAWGAERAADALAAVAF